MAFGDVLVQGSEFCVPRSYVAEFRRKYPSIQIMIDPADGRAGIPSRHGLVKYAGNVDNPDSGLRCSAALITEDFLVGAQSEGDYCDVIRAGDPVLINHRGVPLFGEHEQALRCIFQFIDRDSELGRGSTAWKRESAKTRSKTFLGAWGSNPCWEVRPDDNPVSPWAAHVL